MNKLFQEFLKADFEPVEDRFQCMRCKVTNVDMSFRSMEDCLRHFRLYHVNPDVPVEERVVSAGDSGSSAEVPTGGGLFSSSGGETTSQEIVAGMGRIDDDLPMKTEIKYPVEATVLDLLSEYCADNGLPKTAKVFSAFNRWYRANMVSYKRQGRTEAFEAFKALYLEEMSLKDKVNDIFGAGRK